MKIILLAMLACYSTVSAFSQNQVSIDRIINELDWENCTESDVIFAFKDNIEKRDKDETWDGNAVSSFVLKNVKVGHYTSDANIIVNKYSRKLLKIGGITIGKECDWSKNIDLISQELEDFFSSFWGKEHRKTIDFDTDFDDENIVYSSITCEWGATYHNNKTSKGSFILLQRAKIIVIAIEPK